MHTVCVHGDMKAGNIMVTRDGRFYVIDFGQSMVETDINDKARDQFEVLKDDDRNLARLAVTQFLNVLEG
jgi:RIO-like serine/threonine protein kinase